LRAAECFEFAKVFGDAIGAYAKVLQYDRVLGLSFEHGLIEPLAAFMREKHAAQTVFAMMSADQLQTFFQSLEYSPLNVQSAAGWMLLTPEPTVEKATIAFGTRESQLAQHFWSLIGEERRSSIEARLHAA